MARESVQKKVQSKVSSFPVYEVEYIRKNSTQIA